MNAEQLLALYDRVIEAPDAITRLRRFVLDLAVRGKLVEQDPGDEPASELVRRINDEKTRLVNVGAIGKKVAISCEIVEAPFDLPDSWVWISIGTAFFYDAGIKRKPSALDPSFWLLELEDIEKDTGRLVSRVKSAERNSKSTKSEFRPGDILYGKLRPYLNKVLVADRSGYSTTEIVAIRPYVPLCSDYCALSFRRPDFVEYVTHLGQGTKMPRLRTKDAIVAPFPLPPVPEQHRIVAKADELITLCDQLEKARNARENTRDRLTRASYARLVAPDTDTTALRRYARFAVDSLPAMTARADQVKQLRQTILNLAVSGKLVEQDPADEPATKLLKRIAVERSRLFNLGKIKKPNLVMPIEPKERFFSTPKSWSWVRLQEIGITQTGTTPRTSKPELFGRFIPFVKPADLSGSAINYDGQGLSEKGMHHSRVVPAGTVMMVCIGATLGKTNVTDRQVCFNQQINSVTPLLGDLLPFLLLALKSSNFQAQAWSKAGTGTLPIISKSKWEALPIPLPSLAEQYRIVAKVDELMALCDQLEKAITQADTSCRCLLNALLQTVGAPVATLEGGVNVGAVARV